MMEIVYILKRRIIKKSLYLQNIHLINMEHILGLLQLMIILLQKIQQLEEKNLKVLQRVEQFIYMMKSILKNRY